MRTVLVYRANLLRYSETFIAEQVRHIRNWRAVLLGSYAVPGASTQGVQTRLAYARHPGTLLGWVRRLALEFGVPLPTLLAAARAERPDLVHVHFGTDAVDFWPVARLLNCPVVITLHGWDINIHPEWWSRGSNQLARRSYPAKLRQLARDDRVRFIAVSDAIRNQAIKYGIPEEKIRTTYIGIDVSKFSPGAVPVFARGRHTLYVARFVEKKAPDVLIRAFATVHARIPDATLTMVGDGPLLEPMKELAAGLRLPVRFPGALNQGQILEELHRSRVFVLPSVTARNGDAEGFGMVLLEAQAAGVPVITSARGGAREGIAEGKTGLSFPEGDVGTLAECLKRVLTDDQLAKGMSRSAPTFVQQRFDIATCTAKLEAFYDTAVSECATHA